MKKIFSAVALFLTSCGALQAQTHNNVYIAPLWEYCNSNLSNNTSQAGSLWGVAAGWDYTGHCQYYFGVQGSYAGGMLRGSFGDDQTREYQIEARFGFDFSDLCACVHVIPYVGIGFDEFDQTLTSTTTFNSHFWYVPFGIRFSYQVTSAFSAGLRASYGPTFGGRWSVTSGGSIPSRYIWQAEIPLMYTFCGCHFPIDIALVPFAKGWAYGSQGDLIGQTNTYYGARLEIGMNF